MKLSDFNVVKAHREIESIKSQVTELNSRFTQFVLCLEEREKTLLESIELNNKSDLATADLIAKQEATVEKQQEAINKLESLNSDKEKKLTGISRWIILGVLGTMSLTVQYSFTYDKNDGVIVTPNSESSPILPIAYAASIIAIAAGQDDKIGHIIENIGKKIGG